MKISQDGLLTIVKDEEGTYSVLYNEQRQRNLNHHRTLDSLMYRLVGFGSKTNADLKPLDPSVGKLHDLDVVVTRLMNESLDPSGARHLNMNCPVVVQAVNMFIPEETDADPVKTLCRLLAPQFPLGVPVPPLEGHDLF